VFTSINHVRFAHSWVDKKMFFQHTFISVNNRGRAPSKYVNKLAIGFYFFIPKVKQYGRVKQQDSTPQNDLTLGFKWIKKIAQNIV
jgi:hypothetical protein